MSSQCRIKCRAKPGAFNGELVVQLPTVSSTGQSTVATCLAYSDSVTLRGPADASGQQEAELRAYCLDKKDDLVAVVLPQSTFSNGSSVVVRQDDLVEGCPG